jgi:hypothetical protein
MNERGGRRNARSGNGNGVSQEESVSAQHACRAQRWIIVRVARDSEIFPQMSSPAKASTAARAPKVPLEREAAFLGFVVRNSLAYNACLLNQFFQKLTYRV